MHSDTYNIPSMTFSLIVKAGTISYSFNFDDLIGHPLTYFLHYFDSFLSPVYIDFQITYNAPCMMQKYGADTEEKFTKAFFKQPFWFYKTEEKKKASGFEWSYSLEQLDNFKEITVEEWFQQELGKMIAEDENDQTSLPNYPKWYLCFLERYCYRTEEIEEKLFVKKEEPKREEKSESIISKSLKTSVYLGRLLFKLEDVYNLPLEIFRQYFDTMTFNESLAIPEGINGEKFPYDFPLFQLDLPIPPQKDITMGEWLNHQLLDYISNQEEYQTSVPSYPLWYQYFVEKFQIDPMDGKTFQKKKEN